MKNRVLREFSVAALSIDPDIPMSAKEIESTVKTFGLEHFIRKTGGHAADLAETVELLSRLSKGEPHGQK